MTPYPPSYDARYLRGIEYFNAADYFEAHEVWEELWQECAAEPRRFYEGLIQAAVAIYHASSGNRTGAERLSHSAWAKLSPYAPVYLGIDLAEFHRQLTTALSGLTQPDQPLLDRTRLPHIVLAPPADVLGDEGSMLPEANA